MGGEVIFSAFSVKASAEETTFDIKTSSALADLKGATVDGVPFSVASYNPSKKTEPSFITLCEYGYRANSVEDFDLYVYIYSPGSITLSRESFNNVLYARVGTDKSVSFVPVYLEYVNEDTDSYFGGVFYKYRVALDEDIKIAVFGELDPLERVYEISEYTAYTNIADVTYTESVGQTYRFTGYMQGCSAESARESTLRCKNDKGEVLHLDVHSTYYRPAGIKNAQGTEYEAVIDAQDSLHSVYFSVPNTMLAEYGAMSAVHATWRDALLAPSVVVGDNDVFHSLNGLLDQTVPSDGYTSPYLIKTDFEIYSGMGQMSGQTNYMGYCYGFTPTEDAGLGGDRFGKWVTVLRHLYLAPSDGTQDNADKYTLPRETIKQYVKERSQKLIASGRSASTVIAGKTYADVLFEYISPVQTEVNIKATEEFTLESQIVSQNFWQSLFGIESVNAFDDMKLQAIYPVKAEDFRVTFDAVEQEIIAQYPEQEAILTAQKVARRLAISEGDYAHFKAFYDEKTAVGETVYLFRYRTSDYLCEEATVVDVESRENSTNGYVFQMNVDLGFDIIDVTFSKDGMDTVVPVVMEAQNVFHDATPPVNTTTDEENSFWDDISSLLKIILGLVGLVLLLLGLSFAMPFFRPILDFIGKLIGGFFSLLFFPFRALGRLFFGGRR